MSKIKLFCFLRIIQTYKKDKQDEYHRTGGSEDEEAKRGCIHKTVSRSIYKTKKSIFPPTWRHLFRSRKKSFW